MIVVDASVWVGRFLPQDAFHTLSRTWLTNSTLAAQTLVVPTTVFAEIAGAISRRTGHDLLGYEIVQQIRKLPTLQPIQIDNTLGDLAAELASTYRLKGADAVYLAVAHRLQIPLVSWDEEQLRRASAVVKSYRPDAPDV